MNATSLVWMAYFGWKIAVGCAPLMIDDPNQSLIQLNGNIDCSQSPSGKHIATLSEMGTIVVWSTETKTQLANCQPKLSRPKNPKQTVYEYSPATALCFSSINDDVLYFCTFQGFQRWHWKKNGPPKILTKAAQLAFRKDLLPILATVNMTPCQDGKKLCLTDWCGNMTLIDLNIKAKPFMIPSGYQLPEVYQEGYFVPGSNDRVAINHKGVLREVIIKDSKIRLQDLAAMSQPEDIEFWKFSQSGRFVATSTKSGNVYLWDLKRNFRDVIGKSQFKAVVLGFSDDEKLLVTGNGGGGVSVYSVDKRKEIWTTKGPKSGFTKIGFLRDNRTIYAIGETPEVLFWKMPKQ